MLTIHQVSYENLDIIDDVVADALQVADSELPDNIKLSTMHAALKRVRFSAQQLRLGVKEVDDNDSHPIPPPMAGTCPVCGFPKGQKQAYCNSCIALWSGATNKEGE